MRLAHRVVLAWGWRRAADRIRRRRGLGAGAGADRPVAGAVPDLPGAGLAGRRRGGRPARRPAERLRRRLVVRLRLFLRRALLDRPRLPGRRQDVRLAAAVRGDRRCPPASRCSPAFGLAFARAIWTRGPVRILSLAIALTVAEWLRGHVLTGFPWNTFGYALTGPLALAQTAALIGIWGLTFLAVAVFATPALFADDRADTRRPWLPLLVGVVRAGGARGLRRDAAGAHADHSSSTTCGCGSCSRICSRTRSSTTPPGRR